MLNARGQEAAPFELLIAVIIMGFVIFVGMNALHDLWLNKCYGTTDAKLEEFKTVLETIVGQKSPYTINFRLSGCFDPSEERIRIVDFDEPKVCAEYCGSPLQLCTTLYYYQIEREIAGIRKCLNIPSDTVFPSQQFVGGRCKGKDGYKLQDFDVEVQQGDYLLLNKTLSTDILPTICAYRSEEG